MFIVTPDYYEDFYCRAGECRHTCCKGWEIDIDPDSLARYQKDGLAHISLTGTPHFVLDAEERCPYLNSENLCKLIIEHGERYLCQICRDHPRFRSYWETGEEIGLGLCCEEAAALILGRTEPMHLCFFDTETGEQVTESVFEASLPGDEAALFRYRSALLQTKTDYPAPLERLREYFLFRHIPDALYDDRLPERVAFAADAVQALAAVWCESANPATESLCAAARCFSENTEYDDEMMNTLLDAGEEERRTMLAALVKGT